MIEVGIVGATGYMGGEALRVLFEHPNVKIKWITSRKQDNIANYHPNLFGLNLNLIPIEETTPCDIVFVALPTSVSLPVINDFLQKNCKVIDLGAAFRLKNLQDWETVYNMKHPYTNLVQDATYGISELHYDEIKNSSLIANPGCFASSAIIGMAPLIAHEIVDCNRIIVDGLSGTAGAGADLSRPTHHPEIANNIVPYNVVDHRHTYEMEQELSLLSPNPVTIHFTSIYVPIVRGILSICHSFPKEKISRKDLLYLYKTFYKTGGHYAKQIFGISRRDNHFFLELAANNSKVWFDEHRSQYDEFVVPSSKQVHDQLNTFSIAVVVRNILRWFMDGVKLPVLHVLHGEPFY